MAIIRLCTDQKAADEWIASRPPIIQEMIRNHPPDRLYRMKQSGHRCTIHSYNENGTLTVDVTGEFNRVVFSRKVFGVDPSDLTECDLPAPEEDVGDMAQEAGYSEEDVLTILIPKIREDMKRRGVLSQGEE